METAKAVGVDQNIDANRGRTFWYAKLTFKDTAARDKMIQFISEQAKCGFEREHGTLKYACLTSTDNPDDPSLWAIEEYANGDAIRFHATSDSMKPIFGYIGSGVMVSPLQKTTVEFLEGLEILKPGITQVDHPIVHITEIDLKTPLNLEDVKLWSNVVEVASEEPEIWFFGVGQSPEDDTKLTTIATYTSKKIFNDSNAKIKAAAQPILTVLEDNTVKTMSVLLRLNGGFLYKEPSGPFHRPTGWSPVRYATAG